jgi:predicted GIY-YIG superfamily endonuclease|tara:strand:+ start:237 stop:446 length:210 start_codon:yes stop_codon:yes gene_type:complete
MNIFKKWLNWNFKFFDKPLVLKNEIKIKELEKKTKLQLEKLGRKLGVELDRRLTKSKLINKIKKIHRGK